MSGIRRLRVEVTKGLADEPLDTAHAARRLWARTAVHNVHPLGFVLGLSGALLAVAFALYAAVRAGSLQGTRELPPQTPPPPSLSAQPPDDQLWLDLE